MLAPGWGTGTRGGSPPGVKLGSLPVIEMGGDCVEVNERHHMSASGREESRMGYFCPYENIKLSVCLHVGQKIWQTYKVVVYFKFWRNYNSINPVRR